MWDGGTLAKARKTSHGTCSALLPAQGLVQRHQTSASNSWGRGHLGWEGEECLKWMEPGEGSTSGFFQAPTERQLRYKEKVAELRKKRNSGLSKEQKEKYMVKAVTLFFHSLLSTARLQSRSLFFPVILQHSRLKCCRIQQLGSSMAAKPLLFLS